MLMAFTLVGFDRDLRIYFSRNPIKLDRDWRLGEHHLCSSILFEGLRAELTIVNSYLLVIELFIVIIP